MDIAFLNSDGVITKIAEIEPESMEPVSGQGSMAVEANLGYFSEHSISEGYRANEVKESLVLSKGYRSGKRQFLEFVPPKKEEDKNIE